MPYRHLAAVAAEVAVLAERFEEAGYRLYLVGGIVRDQWLDKPLGTSADIDLTTDALPATIKDLVGDVADALWTQGERFGTIGLRHRGHDIEITTHRAESYTSDSRKPQVSFGDDIAVDLSRRDFTVNAMAVSVPSVELVDPWGGEDDLGAGRLRTPLDPEISFTDDPLRMLRAARFGAKYALAPAPELVTAATELRDRIRIVAIERIGDELKRIFVLDRVDTALDFLIATGLVDELLTWGDDASLAPEVTARLERAAARVPTIAGTWLTRLAGFLLGAFESAEAAAACVARLRLSRDDERSVARAAASAAAALATDSADAPTLRRWAADTDDPEAALAVAVALDSGARASEFRDAWHELGSTEDPAALTVLDGATIMAALGVGPGPIIGEATRMLQETVFDRGPLPPEAQRAVLATWWAERP